MTEQDNLQVAKAAIAAINAHDMDGFAQNFDESYVGESEILPAPVQGRAGARQMLQNLLQAFPDVHSEVEQMIASGNTVVTRSLMTGTQKGNFAGIAPTNKKVSWHSCVVIEVKNGKAIRGRVYADHLSLFRQLGVVATPQATATAR
jgi:steroid delta-isomerase-like uncharacterized protein